MKQQIDEWKAKYLRALADYQNLERRTHEEWQEKQTRATLAVISKILPILDTIRKAADHLQDPGLNLGTKSFTDVLVDLGVVKLDVIGLTFDPATMECIDVVDGEENKVLDELLPGYIYKGILLRPAKVKVGKTKGG
jgi:molecular chaperone GrpE